MCYSGKCKYEQYCGDCNDIKFEKDKSGRTIYPDDALCVAPFLEIKPEEKEN